MAGNTGEGGRETKELASNDIGETPIAIFWDFAMVDPWDLG
jgi:hypothetical protein